MSDPLHLALWTCAACGREWYTAYPRTTGDWNSVEPNYCPYCGVARMRPFTCRATVLAETRMEGHQPTVRPLLGQWADARHTHTFTCSACGWWSGPQPLHTLAPTECPKCGQHDQPYTVRLEELGP